jgi:alpha-N-arabinofuranosidase
MISYCYGNEALKKMLSIAGEHIDFLADRGFEEGDLEAKLNILNDYNWAHGTQIKYCNTEWLPLNGADVYNMVPRSETKTNKCFLFSKWSYALDAAATLMMWQRYGQSIDFINFNNLANTHAQSAIETPKEGAFVTAAGMMLRRFALTQAYRTLVIRDYHPKRKDPIQVQLSEDESGQNLVLNVLNRSENSGTLEIDLSEFDVRDKEYSGVILAGDSLISMNRLNDEQIKEFPASVTVADGRIGMTVRPLSFSEYVFEIRRGSRT